MLTKDVRTYPIDNQFDGLKDIPSDVLTDNISAIREFNKQKLTALKVADFTIFAEGFSNAVLFTQESWELQVLKDLIAISASFCVIDKKVFR